MVRTFASIAVAFAALSLAAPASAAILVFERELGPEALGATGSGFGRATFDTEAHTLVVDANWAGLSGTTTVAHIHCCVAVPETGTVGVAVTHITFPGFPEGLSSGTYSSPVLDLTVNGTYTTAFRNNFGGGTAAGAEAALINGLLQRRAYLNIHSTTFTGGEIRGFLLLVPEPQSWALMIVGFGLLGGAMRYSRRRSLAQA